MSNRTNTRRVRRRAVSRALVVAACVVGLAAVPAAASAANEKIKVVHITPNDPTPVFSSWPTNAGTQPVSVTGGPDGNVWYTEDVQPGDDWGVGRLTFAGQNAGPEGSILNVFNDINGTGPAPHGDLFDITAGPDGNLWATGFFGEVIRVTTAGVASHQTAGITGSDLEGITSGPNNELWFTEGEPGSAPKIGTITTHGAVHEFSAGITPNSLPLDITEADGDLWFTEFNSGNLGEITPQGTVHEFLLSNDGLFGIAADDGYLWVTNQNDDTIYRVDPSDCSATLHDCNDVLGVGLANEGFGDGEPGSIAAGPDGNVWFTDGSALGRITPGTVPQVSVTAFPQADAGVAPGAPSSQSISSGPDGTLWYVQPAGSLGEVSFCGQVLCDGEVTIAEHSAELSDSLRQASAVGILVERRAHGRLVPVGHVPLGHHPARAFSARWNLRIDGHRLPAGRYTITLRALNNHTQVIDKAVPVTITVR